MLEELSIRGLGPIRSADIHPAAGMTAITGETGAGKSMLLSAIRLISGGAADSGRVSGDTGEAWAQGVFAVDEDAPAAALAREAGVEPEDGELFLTRTVPASGRSRAVLGGHAVPRSVLTSIAASLVAIHGQADQLTIASPARQRAFLDRYADDGVLLEAYRGAWHELKDMDARLVRLRGQESDARQRADYLRESVARIDAADPKAGEDTELKARRDRIENAAEIREGICRALGALDASQVDVDSDARGAAELIEQAIQALRSIRVEGEFSALADRLDSLNAEVSDVVFTLAGQLDDEGDEGDLDAINARIHELDELTKRWGPTLADVIAWRDKAAFEVEDLDASPEKLAELETQRASLFDAALAAAGELSAARVEAAERLGQTVSGELASLAMAGASLEVHVTPREENGVDDDGNGVLDAHGRDDIEFLFMPFPGSPQLPMGKSASGGELSRLMLALELAVAERRGGEGPSTFIFDEVDAGVGGKAALELGARLARLARSAQVIVVTHLAQVASWADAQFVVAKGPDDGEDSEVAVVSTSVHPVEGEERVHEIARMLSGSESEASLDHARELLKESELA